MNNTVYLINKIFIGVPCGPISSPLRIQIYSDTIKNENENESIQHEDIHIQYECCVLICCYSKC